MLSEEQVNYLAGNVCGRRDVPQTRPPALLPRPASKLHERLET